jgi:RNA polymerase sigma-70 factor (ECF subfamily)
MDEAAPTEHIEAAPPSLTPGRKPRTIPAVVDTGKSGTDRSLELVRRARDGEQQAFGTLYRLHAPRVKGYLRRSGFRDAEADDLTQETFARVFRSLETFDESRGRFATWLGTIARNVARRQWSRRAQPDDFDPELADEMFSAPYDRDRDAAHREEVQAVRGCIAKLPVELRNLVELRYVQALTTRALSARLSIPEATVRLRLKEAQALLLGCLRSQGVEM